MSIPCYFLGLISLFCPHLRFLITLPPLPFKYLVILYVSLWATLNLLWECGYINQSVTQKMDSFFATVPDFLLLSSASWKICIQIHSLDHPVCTLDVYNLWIPSLCAVMWQFQGWIKMWKHRDHLEEIHIRLWYLHMFFSCGRGKVIFLLHHKNCTIIWFLKRKHFLNFSNTAGCL